MFIHLFGVIFSSTIMSLQDSVKHLYNSCSLFKMSLLMYSLKLAKWNTSAIFSELWSVFYCIKNSIQSNIFTLKVLWEVLLCCFLCFNWILGSKWCCANNPVKEPHLVPVQHLEGTDLHELLYVSENYQQMREKWVDKLLWCLSEPCLCRPNV